VWPVAGLSGYWLLASNPTNKVNTATKLSPLRNPVMHAKPTTHANVYLVLGTTPISIWTVFAVPHYRMNTSTVVDWIVTYWCRRRNGWMIKRIMLSLISRTISSQINRQNSTCGERESLGAGWNRGKSTKGDE